MVARAAPARRPRRGTASPLRTPGQLEMTSVSAVAAASRRASKTMAETGRGAHFALRRHRQLCRAKSGPSSGSARRTPRTPAPPRTALPPSKRQTHPILSSRHHRLLDDDERAVSLAELSWCDTLGVRSSGLRASLNAPPTWPTSAPSPQRSPAHRASSRAADDPQPPRRCRLPHRLRHRPRRPGVTGRATPQAAGRTPFSRSAPRPWPSGSRRRCSLAGLRPQWASRLGPLDGRRLQPDRPAARDARRRARTTPWPPTCSSTTAGRRHDGRGRGPDL